MPTPNQLGPISTNYTLRGGPANTLTTPANFLTVAALDAALTTANATYYTAALLQKLSINDKAYAVRQITSPTTI